MMDIGNAFLQLLGKCMTAVGKKNIKEAVETLSLKSLTEIIGELRTNAYGEKTKLAYVCSPRLYAQRVQVYIIREKFQCTAYESTCLYNGVAIQVLLELFVKERTKKKKEQFYVSESFSEVEGPANKEDKYAST